MLGLLLPTAVSHTLLAAVTPAPAIPHTPNDPPYLKLLPNCGSPATNPGPVALHVLFEEWPTNETLSLYWDGNLVQTWPTGHRDSFSQAISRTVPQQPLTVTVTAVSGGATTISQTFTIPCSQGTVAEIPHGRDVYTGHTHESGILTIGSAALHGPDICTSYGDPFSPLNSIYQPGFYTYHYRIRIPADYENRTGTAIVRVELFDPDSINVDAAGPFTFARTQAAQDAGLPATGSGSCIVTNNRKNPCLVNTGELALYQNGTLPLEAINPFWFVRVDENRGTSTPGQCGEPSSYTAAYNTATLYQLYYFQPDGSAYRRVNLAAYTGQVEDGVRDNGDHQTDMQWVSPGAEQSFDYLGPGVPADPGSPGDFEIDLAAELPNVVTDPQTGDRYIYLDIITLSGASENSFEIWAGPPTYINTVPGQVNGRNLHALNNPGSHHAHGITVQAMQNLPRNNFFPQQIDIPLTYIGPENAGQDITISVFDYDQSDTEPPIIFFFDSMADSDWSLTFGQPGTPDPDGQVRNCTPGPSCNNLWVTPPYSITLPGGNPADCDYSNPQNDPDCIPFPGGRLMARITSGYQDTHQWEVTPPTLTPGQNPGVGCAAFPITIHANAQSVTQALYETVTGSPNFYPNPAPPYSSFFDHSPDVPLFGPGPNGELIHEGDIFLVEVDNVTGSSGWLVWNQYVSANAATLEHGLTWPGDSQNYTSVAPGQTPPGFPHPVYGYIDYNDPTDTSLHIGDWVAANTGVVNSSGVRTALEEQIDSGRVLRLPIYDTMVGTGSDTRYQMVGFALFRPIGYELSANGQAGSHLLLEFIRWDDSCGQTNIPLNDVSISGPTAGLTNTNYVFTATAAPFYATMPITYVWDVAGQPPITQTGDIADVINLSWPLTGTYMLTVTAVNPFGGPVTATHTITIAELLMPDLTVIGPPQLVTPLPVGAGLPVSFTVTIANVGDADVDTQFFVDVFINPTVILTNGIPITESSGFTAVPALAMGESVTLTINAPLGFPELPPTHTVYAMVDSLDSLAESDETNNVSASLTVTDVRPLLAGVTIFGPALGLTGETYTFTAVVTPTTISDPITYTWFLDSSPLLTMTNGTAVPITLTWPLTGSFDLLVMASHGFNTVTDTHTIVITDTLITDLAVIGAPQLLTPGLVAPDQPVSFTVTIANVGNMPLTGPIQTDIFLHPAIVLSDSIPITQSHGFVVVNGLGVGETAVFTFTIPAGFGPGPLYRQVYAMVDSLQTIPEADETNNVSLPLEVVVGRPLYLPIVLRP